METFLFLMLFSLCQLAVTAALAALSSLIKSKKLTPSYKDFYLKDHFFWIFTSVPFIGICAIPVPLLDLIDKLIPGEHEL